MLLVVKILLGLLVAATGAWTWGALYYDVAKQSWWGHLLGVLWVGGVVAMFWRFDSFWLALSIYGVSFGLILIWWFAQKPSNNHDWDPNFDRLPQLTIDGDTLTVTNLRNTHYRTLEDYDASWETRTYSMANLKAVDILILYWGSDAMCHPLAVFDFGEGGHLCFSIEVRYRKNDTYGVLKGFYRQNELMYVVSDERDAILRRTKYSEGHEVYLYRIQKGPGFVRQLFDDYMEPTNDLLENPRWYNTVTSNCTTSIYWQRKGAIPWDWRMLFNGTLDQMLYDWERLYQGLPFSELREASLINERANAASEENFGQELREGLPGF